MELSASKEMLCSMRLDFIGILWASSASVVGQRELIMPKNELWKWTIRSVVIKNLTAKMAPIFRAGVSAKVGKCHGYVVEGERDKCYGRASRKPGE